MKTKNRLWAVLLVLAALSGLTGCKEDQKIGYKVQGHWFGDLDMWLGNEKARGSEIEFTPDGWGYRSGVGLETDYYRYGFMQHEFEYTIENGVIYMLFDDPALDCAIADYRLTSRYFSGYIADYFSLVNRTYFTLKNYDIYWNSDGYGSGYYPYYEKRHDEPSDSTETAGKAIEATGLRSIRGVNKARFAE